MQDIFEKIIEKLEEEKVKGIYDSSSIIGEKNVWYKAIEIVKQEAEQYNNGWIPCSDRLPEANQMVLATEKDSEYVILCCYEFFEGYGYGFNGSNGNVIAWMELPQPYQPKGEING